ncbi:MAG: protein kinase, partial [Myxococcales bacterium]|nr:protein kinase [Myxococcales bacterium]
MTAITVTPPPSLASTRGRMCPRCGRFPASDGRCGEHGLFAVAPEAAAKKEIAPLLGQVVAERYILIDLLGDGGMASVYRAVDARLDRSVAVKVRTGLNALTDEDRARFESEARALSRLRSPHTVTVHDYGVAADMGLAGLAYIVMEQVEGEDLHARLSRGALSPRATLAIL